MSEGPWVAWQVVQAARPCARCANRWGISWWQPWQVGSGGPGFSWQFSQRAWVPRDAAEPLASSV